MLRALLCTLLLFPAPFVSAGQDERIVVVIEEPAQGERYSGVSNLRGWAVSPEGMGRSYLNVYIDDEFAFYLAPYGERSDVGKAFPDYPDSDTGGFSMAFNYKNLSPGEHEIRVRAYDDAGNYNEAVTTFVAERFESEFIASDSDVDLSTTSSIYVYDDQSYLISGPTIEGKQWDFLLRWDTAGQSFKTEGISPFSSYGSGTATGGVEEDEDIDPETYYCRDSGPDARDDPMFSSGDFWLETSTTVPGVSSFPIGSARLVKRAGDRDGYFDFGSAGRNGGSGRVYMGVEKGVVTVSCFTLTSDPQPAYVRLSFGITAQQPSAAFHLWISKRPDGSRIEQCEYVGYAQTSLRFSVDGSQACNLERGGEYFINVALCDSVEGDVECRSIRAETAEDDATFAVRSSLINRQ